MGSTHPCENLSLTSLRLVKASVDVLKEEIKGGNVKFEVNTEFGVAGSGQVNEKNAGSVLLTVSVVGQEGGEDENESERDRAFTIEAQMRGTFLATEGIEFSLDQFVACYKWAATQVYLPLREYILNTFARMGLRLTLPLVIPEMDDTEESDDPAS